MIVNATNFRPLRGLVLVRRDKPESENGGIIIPENVQTYGWRATVLRAGPEATSYIEGENILFLKVLLLWKLKAAMDSILKTK